MYNGVINLYKEAGYTSHDVVAKMRGILRQKKIGHTGTLDPAATGVLPVCLGTATKLCDLFTDRTKEYRAIMQLGIVTDTQDTTGTILQTAEVSELLLTGDKCLEKAILSFEGGYDQIPPMYSALKVDGKKLYELARQGKVIERKARSISLYNIEIEQIALPFVTFRVSCSKGTYIRTLCHDIGEKIGCGAAMARLERTRVGDFTADQALTLEKLEALTASGMADSAILPVEDVLSEYRRINTLQEADKLLCNGNPVSEILLATVELPSDGEETGAGINFRDEEQIRLCDSNGRFLGLYSYRAKERRFWPVKMFIE